MSTMAVLVRVQSAILDPAESVDAVVVAEFHVVAERLSKWQWLVTFLRNH